MAQTTSTKTTTTPEVGMGATYGTGGDSYPATVVSVSASGKSLEITNDEIINGTWNEGEYSPETYTTLPDMDGARTTYTLRKNGTWVAKGCPMSAWYCRLYLGRREYRQNPHF
jgi:hypothetical protein